MRIPKTFLVKGVLWKTKRIKNLKDDDGEPASDLTSPDKKLIEIDSTLEGENLEWVFWHAYCHALLEESGVVRNTGGLTDLQEEIICDNFADTMVNDQLSVKWKRRKK